MKNQRIKKASLPIVLLLASQCFFRHQAQAAPSEAQPELVQLQKYKPIYLIVGRPDTKVQFSFKAPISKAVPLYFGYTQLLMWDTGRTSFPFRDINHNPEAFYRLNLSSEKNLRWLDLGLYEHESNGRDGDSSRSWDRVSVRYQSRHDLGDRLKLHWSIKAWYPFNFDPENRDFPKFRGLWELELTLEHFLGPFFDVSDLIFRMYPGGDSKTNPLLGGQELTARVRPGSRVLLPLIVFQVFHGYGENMLDYKQDRFGLRGGIGF